MKFFLSRGVLEPIDNFLVREFQPMGTSFCTYPLLATQADTYSDIENSKPNWDIYIRRNYENNVRDVLPFRNNI